MKLIYRTCILTLGLFDSFSTIGQPASELQLLEIRKIWDKAPHNAFTGLIRFNERWFCVFREGEDYVSPDGALRVITSKDGDNWESAALVTASDMDLLPKPRKDILCFREPVHCMIKR